MDMDEDDTGIRRNGTLGRVSDLCGRAFGGPGLTKAIVAVGHVNVCVDACGGIKANGVTLAEVGARVGESNWLACLIAPPHNHNCEFVRISRNGVQG